MFSIHDGGLLVSFHVNGLSETKDVWTGDVVDGINDADGWLEIKKVIETQILQVLENNHIWILEGEIEGYTTPCLFEFLGYAINIADEDWLEDVARTIAFSADAETDQRNAVLALLDRDGYRNHDMPTVGVWSEKYCYGTVSDKMDEVKDYFVDAGDITEDGWDSLIAGNGKAEDNALNEYLSATSRQFVYDKTQNQYHIWHESI